MPDLDFLPLFLDFYERYGQLPYEERGRLVWAMLAYARDEDPDPHLTDNLRLYAFNNEKGMIDRTRKTYAERKERRKAASLAGVAARQAKATNGNESSPIVTNRNHNENKNKNEDENKNKNKNENENEGGARTYASGRTRSAHAHSIGQETIL